MISTVWSWSSLFGHYNLQFLITVFKKKWKQTRANIIDEDQISQNAASDQDLHCSLLITTACMNQSTDSSGGSIVSECRLSNGP